MTPTDREPSEEGGPTVVPLRYGLVAVYTLKEKPPPRPPVCREAPAEPVPWPPEDWEPEPW